MSDVPLGEGVCPVGECGASIPIDKLMCPSHWRRCPRAERQAVYAALHRYNHQGETLDQLRVAQRAAVTAVEAVAG